MRGAQRGRGQPVDLVRETVDRRGSCRRRHASPGAADAQFAAHQGSGGAGAVAGMTLLDVLAWRVATRRRRPR